MTPIPLSRKRNWPVVDGEPVKPYELPDDPAADAEQMRRMEARDRLQRERDRTWFRRSLLAIIASSRARKGEGFEWTFLGCTVGFHHLSVSSGHRLQLEFYREERWYLDIEWWRRPR